VGVRAWKFRGAVVVGIVALTMLWGGLSAQAPPAARPSAGQRATPARSAVPSPAKVAPVDRLAWWRTARFGLFIHWGLYAVPAGEWAGRTDHGEWIRNNAKIPLDVYDRFRFEFEAAAFDPLAWVRMAKHAGMRYIVITTKHHDGFAMFDSKVSTFNVMSTPFKRDVIRELVTACRTEGMRVGFYYSIMDWHHPDYLPRRDWETDRTAVGADFERYVRDMKSQLRELLTHYGPIDVLWFDGQWESNWNNERGRDLYQFVRRLQPNIIINNRVGSTAATLGQEKVTRTLGDFGTPEQEVPATGIPGLDWETCLTMNRNWGYNRADKEFKSVQTLVRTLVDVASKGGNLLLNVGPDADGRVPPDSVERLAGLGRWMHVNEESIRGTSASPFSAPAWGRATMKARGAGTRVYLHVFEWPAEGKLRVDGLASKPTRAFLLGLGPSSPLKVETTEAGQLTIEVPLDTPDRTDTVVVIDLPGRLKIGSRG
jgi:alpha-L-fucosidase